MLDVLAGGGGVQMLASTPSGPAHPIPDLRQLLLSAGVGGWHRLACETPEIGGRLAAAVGEVIREARRVPPRQRASLATGFGCVPGTS